MIDSDSLVFFRAWFNEYVNKYSSTDGELQRNIDLKAEHTGKVCEEILDISASLFLSEEEVRIAETTALFHDVGRFEQYVRYGTFADSKSENHATLGAKVLEKEKVLDRLNQQDKVLILCTVANHNKAVLPEIKSERCLFFLRLLRDADKLDIWRVVTEYYKTSGTSRNKAIELNLPDTPEISSEIVENIMAEKIVNVSSLKTLNDFKLLQIAWVFDLTFRRTFEILLQRQYLTAIRNTLPESAEVRRMFGKVDSYINYRMNSS